MQIDTSQFYCNIDDRLKKIAKGIYTENQLKYGLHCIQDRIRRRNNDAVVYILPARNGYRRSGYSGVDLIFEKTQEGKWQVTEECRKVVFVDENNISKTEYLDDILKDLEVGTIITEKIRFDLLRLKDLLV